MSSDMKKDWAKLRKQAEQQGWRVVETNNRHYKWFAPDGKTIVVSGSTTSCSRGMKNQLAMMRKAGFRD